MIWPTGDEWWIKFAIGLLSFLAVAGNVFLAWRKQRKIDDALVAVTHDQTGQAMREGASGSPTALFFSDKRVSELVHLMDRLSIGQDRADRRGDRILDTLDRLLDRMEKDEQTADDDRRETQRSRK